MKISVIIPVYKKSEMFLEHLKHNIPYIQDYDIVVIDDASDENISEKVHALFPQIRVIENDKNLGFAPTVNIGIHNAKGDYILLLNSDVRLIKKFDEKRFELFTKEPELFGISFMQIERDGGYVGKNVLSFQSGFPYHSKASDLEYGPNAWAECGSCILRKSFCKQLGGLNEIFAPFYWEDIDLSYRARSRGWSVVFDPKILVEHHHESTIRTFYKEQKVKAIAYRNQFLFTWSNITDGRLFFHHLFLLPKHMIIAFFKRDFAFIKGFMTASTKFSAIKRSRAIKILHEKIPDVELLFHS